MIEPTAPPACLARGDCKCVIGLGDLAKELDHSEPFTGDIWVEIDNSTGLSTANERINEGDMIESGVTIKVNCGQCSCYNGALKCSKINCSDDCQWAQWQSWGSCTATCGTGIRQRNRTVLSPARFDGEQCQAIGFQETELCNQQDCPCIWSQWAEWSDCSAPCNGGLKIRRRSSQGSCSADDSSMETALCNVHACGATTTSPGVCTDGKVQRDCKDVSCPHTCAQVANETCNEALTCVTGCFCQQGKVFDEKVQSCVTPDQCTCDLTTVTCGTCSQAACVNGVATCTPSPNCDCTWDSWSVWTPCSLACGGGNRTRSRAHATQRRGSGRACTGPSAQTQTCNTGACRGCTDRFGNVLQPGATMQSENACEICYCSYFTNLKVCVPKADSDKTKPTPSWSTWSPFSACSAPCGTGNRHRSRSCVRVCAGDTRGCSADPITGLRDVDRQACNEQSCQPKVDCKVSDWRNGTCLANCDAKNPTALGQVISVRDIVQTPSNGGASCPNLQQTTSCTKTCPVDCVVGEWSPWSECAKTCPAGSVCNPSCGVGARERTRSIARPASNGGEDCYTKEYKPCLMPCNETVCSGPETVVSCATKCWRTCDDVRANKKCSSPSCMAGCGCAGDNVLDGNSCVNIAQCNCTNPSNPSEQLPPGSVVMKDCNKCSCDNGQFVCEKKSCATDCEWSPWQKVGGCNVTCGSGKQQWTRSISKAASNGGAECVGSTSRVTDCFGDEGACCNPNDTYVDSGRCEPTCQQLLNPEKPQAGSSCTSGCQCKPGMVRASSGACISIQDCFSCVVNGVSWPNGKEELNMGNCSKRYCVQNRIVTEPMQADELSACAQSDEILASLPDSVKVIDKTNCCYRASLSACKKDSTLLRSARRPNGTLCQFRQPISIPRCAGACPSSNSVQQISSPSPYSNPSVNITVQVMGECSCCKPVGYKPQAPRLIDCVDGERLNVMLYSIDRCECSMKTSQTIG